MKSERLGHAWSFGLLLFGLALVGWFSIHAAQAVAVTADPPQEPSPELLWQSPEDEQSGAGDGRMFNPQGIAASPSTGNLFVADRENHRIVEFDVWGEFVRSWGYGVQNGNSALQTCTSGCQAGISGNAAGQLSEPQGMAVDGADSVYVYDTANRRVVKYDSQGNLLLTFGGAGTGPGQFSNGSVGDYVDVSPTGTIFVGDQNRIQEFEPNGTFKAEITFTGELAALAGSTVEYLAVDPVSGDLYFTVTGSNSVYRISSTGQLRGTVQSLVKIDGQDKNFPLFPLSLTVDSAGNLYVVDHLEDRGPYEVLKFSPTGECLICGQDFAQPDNRAVFGIRLNGLATGSACGIDGDDLYVTEFDGNALSFVRAYGPPPEDVVNCPPPKRPPSIVDQFARFVGAGEASVQARINPRFFADTTYYVQFGKADCLASNWQQGCSTVPAPPGATLTSKVLNRPVLTQPVELGSLDPDTTYHYRFIAQSSGSDGNPVKGVGGTVSTEGASSSFRTLPPPLSVKTDCANQVFRTGISAFLPDCRAFEMVSPVDKNGGDIDTQKSLRNYRAALDVTALDGNSMTFSSSTAFAGAVSSPFVSQYRALRNLSGWQTEAISPPRQEPILPIGTLVELDLQFKLFTPSLDQAWLTQEADPPLDDCGIPGFLNLYRRDSLTGAYEAITTAPPPTKTPIEYLAEVQGISADGTRTVFRANDRLTPDAAAIGGYQLYEHIRQPGGCGQLRLVSVLPGETASTTPSTVGSALPGTEEFKFIESRENLVDNAVSSDASRVYWTAAPSGPGVIYVRVRDPETEERETKKVSSGAARFWAAAKDGSAAYYIQNGTLRRYSLANNQSANVIQEVIGLMGVDESASRAYVVSEKDEDEGGAAVTGEPNVYFVQGSNVTYVTTLSEADVSVNSAFGPANPAPALHTAQVTDDGSNLVFTSDRSLTGQDNTDVESGLPDTQVYLYDAEAETLRCISCNSTGARPVGQVVRGVNNTNVGLASRIPPWKNQFHAPRVISEDGSRLFFETFETLTPRDVDGGLDVYGWTRAASTGECQAIGAEFFSAQAGGCLSLLSSGTDPEEAELVDSTPDGSSVFVKTNTSLLPQDPGRIDIYVARAGGGFPPPPAACAGPAECPPPQPTQPPAPPGPQSVSGGGDFNPKACERLERKAQKARKKARKLRGTAREAAAPQARKLRTKAGKLDKKAKRLDSRAQKCHTTARGK